MACWPWLVPRVSLSDLRTNNLGKFRPWGDTRLGGVYNFIYMAGWMCSLYGLLRLKATGNSFFGRLIFYINILTLTLANIQNLAQVILPKNIFNQIWLVLDVFWPISHLLMLVIGIAVINAKILAGWKRYAPLTIGLWLPIAFSIKYLPVNAEAAFYLMAFYTPVAWSLLATAVRPPAKTRYQKKLLLVLIHPLKFIF